MYSWKREKGEAPWCSCWCGCGVASSASKPFFSTILGGLHPLSASGRSAFKNLGCALCLIAERPQASRLPCPHCSAGFHRVKPLHQDYLHIGPTMRASAYIYNTKDEIRRFVAALRECMEVQQRLRKPS